MHSVVVDRASGAAVVTATGELDAFVAPDLTSAFTAVEGEPRVLADLGGVSFMDSTALGLLVRATRTLEAAGATFRVVLPRGSARRIFEITALERVLPVAEDRDAALEQLAGANPIGA
ncbi:MAG TPA: STAS domain-containing protein [Gaiellaceae bacterium]|nr:STAS domain-containing protein [Gaiellaceae bacterium]